MRQLKKIILHEAVVLENQEMKMVFGGSGIGGKRYKCSCNSGIIAVPWEGLYVNDKAKNASINMNCGSVGGNCIEIS